MKYLFLFLFVYILWTNSAFAKPSELDRQEALKLIYTANNGQDQTFLETSNYQSIAPRMIDSLIVSSCAYSTLDGKGYISTVSKVENGKVYVIQRHEGDSDPIIYTNWTCTNCTGESYDIFTALNEHGLCTIKEKAN